MNPSFFSLVAFDVVICDAVFFANPFFRPMIGNANGKQSITFGYVAVRYVALVFYLLFSYIVSLFTYSEIVARQISLSIGFLDSSEQHLHMYS